MTSYDSILSGETAMLYQGKYDENTDKAHEKSAAFKKYNLAFKAAPAKGQSVSHSWVQEESGNPKTKTAFNFKHDDLSVETVRANDKASIKVAYPLSSDDWKVDGDASYELKAGKEEKITGAVHINSPDMSGALLAVNVTAEQKKKWADKKWGEPALNVDFDAAVTYEKDWHVGVAGSHDTKNVSGLEFVVAKDEGKDKYWAGYNVDSKQVKAGCKQVNAEHGFTHVYEARYNTKDGAAAQAWGHPLTLAAGGKYVLSDKTTCNYMFEQSAKPHAIFKWVHKLDKNWQVAMTQSFNHNNVEGGNPYSLGFDATYQL